MFYYNERLMLARKKRDLTQNELSQRLGLKQQQYEKYKKVLKKYNDIKMFRWVSN